MPKTKESKVPQALSDIACPECKCDLLLPLMRIRLFRDFSASKIQVEWPSNAGREEYANLACPRCGAVMVLYSSGRVVLSENRVYLKNGKKGKRG